PRSSPGSSRPAGDADQLGARLAATPPAAPVAQPGAPGVAEAGRARREGEGTGVPGEGQGAHEPPDPESYLSHGLGPAALEPDVADPAAARLQHGIGRGERTGAGIDVPGQTDRSRG